MRILLIDEFSSLHKYLKDGLVKLGHEATIAAKGDGFKKIPFDIDISLKGSSFNSKLINYKTILTLIIKSRNYDVTQIVQPLPFRSSRRYILNCFFMALLFKFAKNVFLVGAGAVNNDSNIADFYETSFKYPSFFQIIKDKYAKNNLLFAQTVVGRKYNRWLQQKITGYIPIMYEYAEPYRLAGYKKLCPTIPIPINLDEVKYQPNVIKDKIVIFHGLNRPLVKGTPIIQEAFEKLQKDYLNDVETVIDGKMPLKDYLELMKRTNVTIDQTYCVSSGVNGLLSMAMGKVTLGGGELEALKEFSVTDCPMIPIKPDSNDIYDRLVEVIKRKNEIPVIGEKSRKYIEEVHDYVKIAQKYVDIWSSY